MLLRPFSMMSQDVFNTILGCCLALLAGGCFTASDFVLKEFQLDYVEVLLMRCVLQIVTNAVFIGIRKYDVWPRSATKKDRIFMMLNVSKT